MKVCSTCKISKELTAFSISRANRDGRQGRCKECDRVRLKQDWVDNKGSRRNSRYKLAYGIDIETYDKMLADQGGCCKLCNTPACDSYSRLSVDHCHTTGSVRGLLCHRCNLAIGQFRDDTDLLERAISYLKETR